MRNLGFEANKQALPLRCYVLKKNDVGLNEYPQRVLSADDWQVYQAASPETLIPR